MSSARTVTSISPETPVSFWSVSTSRSAWRSCGTSSWTSEVTAVCVSSASPTTATAIPMASTRRGRDSEKPSVRHERSASHSRAAARAGARAAAHLAERGRARPLAPGREKRVSAAKPAHSAQASAITMPTTSSAPKPRTIGTGERSRTRKPVGGGEPRREDRGPAGRDGGHGRLRLAPRRSLVVARLELDRVVHRQADQHRQRRDRRHRQVAAGERQRAERHGRGGERERQRQQPQPRVEHERERARPSAAAPPRAARRSRSARRPPARPPPPARRSRCTSRRSLGLNAFSAVAVRIRSIARCCSASVRSGRSRIWTRAAFFDGNRYAKRDFGTPGWPVRAVEDERGDEAGVVDARQAADAVPQRQPERCPRRTSPAPPSPPRRRAAAARRAGRRAASTAAGRPRPPAAPAPATWRRRFASSRVIWLTAVLMNVPGP